MDLSKRTITSASWNYLTNFLIFIIIFVRQVILARLLPFEVFGIYSYLASIVFFSLAFPNFGMDSAFLNRDPETKDLDQTAAVYFTLKTMFFTVWLVIMLVGGFIFLDSVYLLTLVVLVLARGVDEVTSQTARIILVKKVTFKRMAVLRLISVALSTILSTLLAMRGEGIWALLSSHILTTILMFIGLFLWRPVWKPRFLWIKGTVKYYLEMGRKNMAAGLLRQALDHVDDIWTGFFLGEVQLAFYSKAYSYAELPNKFLSEPLINVIRGNYAELKGDRKRLSRSFLLFNSLLLRTGFFVGGVMFLIAPEFITILLGERWLPMLRPFQLMLLFALINPIKYSIGNIFVSVGRPEIILRARTVQLIVMVTGLFIFGNMYGIEGVAAAVDLMVILGLVHQLVLVREFVDYSVKDLFLTPLLSIGAGLGLYYLVSVWVSSNLDLITAIQKMGLYSVGFVLVFILLENEIIRNDYLPTLKKAFRKEKGV